MGHIYSQSFFTYINRSASASAEAFVEYLFPLLRPRSVLDLGCGQGAWLARWQAAGVSDISGVDGAYVDPDSLLIDRDAFRAADLTAPVPLDRRFDLAQSLEVGEHLPLSAAERLVETLTEASDRVLFSAAVPGQGGEFHINEQPLAFWQDLFAARGYTAYDCLRPQFRANRAVAPWYRYNAILYVSSAARTDLPEAILQTELPDGARLREGGDPLWRMRRAVVARLPRPAVTQIARLRAALLAAMARQRARSVQS